VDLYVTGTSVMISMVIAINMRLVLVTNHISYISHIVVAVSVFFVFFTVIVMSVINISLFDMHLYYGAGAKSLGSAMVLLTVLLTIVAMGVVDVCHIYLHRMLFPSPTYVIQEQERGHGAKGYGLVAAENGALTPSIGASSGTGAETRAFLDVSDPPPSHHA